MELHFFLSFVECCLSGRTLHILYRVYWLHLLGITDTTNKAILGDELYDITNILTFVKSTELHAVLKRGHCCGCFDSHGFVSALSPADS
jgi:hypothetical protein